MKLGIFIGSFNPPHLGHQKIAQTLINNKYLDKIYFVPTGNYWNKTDLIPLDERIKMLKYFETDNIEVKKVEEDYTYQILRHFPKDTYLIIGADNLENFSKWKNIEEIVLHPIIVINRDNQDINTDYIFVNNFNSDISSTLVKELLLKEEDITPYVGSDIKEYIQTNKLYGGKHVQYRKRNK